MSKPEPPKIAPKPGQVKVVRALYTYTAQQNDELSFNEGDILYITEQITNPDWWRARCGTKSGLIPSNYVEEKTDTVTNPVHDAARRGNMDFLLECLNAGVSATGFDASGNSPLHWSARGGHLDCVEEIIKWAAKSFKQSKTFLSVQNKMGDTPLHVACAKDHLPIVTILLQEGADPLVKNMDNQLPFDLAHDPEIRALLQAAMSSAADDQTGEEYEDDSEEDE